MKVYELIHSSEILMEMPKLPEEQTGFKYPIWIGKVGGQHAARIKVGNNAKATSKFNCFVISIDGIPKIKTPQSCTIPKEHRPRLLNWVEQNKNILIKIADCLEKGGTNFEQLVKQLKTLKEIENDANNKERL